MSERLPAIHPSEILHEEFLSPLGITASQLVNEKRGISAETALRLSHYFGNSAEFWLDLQSHYELREARERHRDDVLTIARYEPQSVAA